MRFNFTQYFTGALMVEKNSKALISKLEKDLKLLDLMYNDIVEAIHTKPTNHNYEDLRLYVDNIYSLLNKTVFRIQELKNDLQEDKQLVLETWNPPA